MKKPGKLKWKIGIALALVAVLVGMIVALAVLNDANNNDPDNSSGAELPTIDVPLG